MKMSPIDVLLIGIFIYLIVKRLLKQKDQDHSQRGNRPDPRDLRPRARNASDLEDEEDERKHASEAYQRAQQAWDMLRDEQNAAAPQEPQGFNEAEFLEGAKLMCVRVRQSWDSRDLDDLAMFCTPEMMEDFGRRADSETRPPKTETLLVKAGLVEIRQRDDNFEEASVLYDILEKQLGSGDNNELREMWTFVRAAGDQSAMWQLASMRPVTDEPANAPQ